MRIGVLVSWVVIILVSEEVIARIGLVFKLCVLLTLQMGFFAEAGPVQIFVSNHVSDFALLGAAS